MISVFLSRKNNILVLVFFFIYFITALSIIPDYGFGWDEMAQHEIGSMNYDYITSGDRSKLYPPHQFYGPVFEVMLIAAENILPVERMLRVYQMRHLFTLLFFFLGVLVFYRMSLFLFQNWKYALLSTALLILSPRIFADSFHNSKDIVFLSAYIMAIFTGLLFLNKRNYKYAILHGLTCAVLIAIRIPGVIVPAITLGIFILYEVICQNYKLSQIKRSGAVLVAFLSSLYILTIAFWPWLWKNPNQGFIEAFNAMSHYNWGGTLLYFGEFYWGTELPWHYIPAWIFITTPILYLLLFLTGIYFFFRLLFRNRIFENLEIKKYWVFVFSTFLLPLLMVIILKSVLYDGWRQMFFIYPPMVLIAVFGFKELLKIPLKISGFPVFRIFLPVLFFISFMDTSVFLIRHHPFQNVYFNNIYRYDMEMAKQKFEMDYWGLSYYQGLKFLSEKDTSDTIMIYTGLENHWPLIQNAMFLNSIHIQKFQFTENRDQATYFLTNYRWRPRGFEEDFLEKLHSFEVKGAAVMSVYKIIDTD